MVNVMEPSQSAASNDLNREEWGEYDGLVLPQVVNVLARLCCVRRSMPVWSGCHESMFDTYMGVTLTMKQRWMMNAWIGATSISV